LSARNLVKIPTKKSQEISATERGDINGMDGTGYKSVSHGKGLGTTFIVSGKGGRSQKFAHWPVGTIKAKPDCFGEKTNLYN